MIRNSRNYIADHLAIKENKSHEMLANVTPHVTQSRNVPYNPFNKALAATTGHAGLRNHGEVKKQALEALRQKNQGKKDVCS